MIWTGLRTASDGEVGGPAAHLDAGVIMALATSGYMHHANAKRVCDADVQSGYVLVASPMPTTRRPRMWTKAGFGA